MRFSAEHRFEAPPSSVAAVLADPDFYRQLELPDVSLEAVVERRVEGAAALVVLRYEFTGSLETLGRRLLGGERLTWTQELRIEDAAGGSLAFSADANPRLLHGQARFTLEPGAGGTVRRLEGELVVAVPAVGGMAERRIVPGVLRRLDAEAAAVRTRLGPR